VVAERRTCARRAAPIPPAPRLEFDDRDDPITEVDAPDGFDAAAFATD
jgi:hypothetical protein